jgi:hypothetical protein
MVGLGVMLVGIGLVAVAMPPNMDLWHTVALCVGAGLLTVAWH